jgi:2-iminobutanoate/2-iminopropanoate deaminase
MAGNESSGARVALAAALATFAASAFAAGTPLEFYKVENGPPGMTLPFSEAVRAGDMLYLAGMVGTDASGKLVAGGVGPETTQVMQNIGNALKKHGSSYDRVVQCTVALADIKEWPAFNEAYKPFFKEHFPARMAFAASGLALNARVEVQCNAVVGK